MTIIGLTGGLAAGKSTVAGMFQKHGAKVISADTIAREALRPGRPGFRPAVKHFGKGILSGGRIDRAKLAKIVFADPQELRFLEKIIHPLVVGEIKRQVRALRNQKRSVVIDAPLLIEAGLDRLVDWVIVVKAPRSIQIKRACERPGMTRAEALRRIKAQMPLKEKMERADVIIDNGRNLRQTEQQVEAIWQRVLRKQRK